MPLSSNIKNVFNYLLHPLGLELITTRKQQAELNRLQQAKLRGHWSQPRYKSGIRIDENKTLKLLNQIALSYQKDYDKLLLQEDKVTQEFYLHNGWFEAIDAELLYSLVRMFQPRTIIEVGSGNSTRLMWRSIRDSNLTTRIISIDPQPRIPIMHHTHEHIATKVETLSVADITNRLIDNDILFIDSSHQILTAGDVPFLYLEVLPNLKPNTLIHIHDVFFPFDYPEKNVLERLWNWTEQYLVHAFLCNNDAFEVLWSARYMWEYHQEALLHAFPNAENLRMLPSSLWLRKIK